MEYLQYEGANSDNKIVKYVLNLVISGIPSILLDDCLPSYIPIEF